MTNTEREAAIRAMAAEGISQVMMAAHFGVSRQRINHIVRKLGIETLSGRYDYDTGARVMALHSEGLSAPEIDRRLGLPANSAYRRLRHAGLTPNKFVRPWKDEPTVRRLAEAGLSATEISRLTAIVSPSVFRIIAKFDIPVCLRFKNSPPRTEAETRSTIAALPEWPEEAIRRAIKATP